MTSVTSADRTVSSQRFLVGGWVWAPLVASWLEAVLFTILLNISFWMKDFPIDFESYKEWIDDSFAFWWQLNSGEINCVLYRKIDSTILKTIFIMIDPWKMIIYEYIWITVFIISSTVVWICCFKIVGGSKNIPGTSTTIVSSVQIGWDLISHCPFVLYICAMILIR